MIGIMMNQENVAIQEVIYTRESPDRQMPVSRDKICLRDQ